jgi:RNA polymerase sigma-70 factor (ECF subfamily)
VCITFVEVTVQTVARADDNVLVHRSQAGDRQAFAVLVERYWDRLYRWMCHMTHDCHAAEDIAQETFLKALKGLAFFRQGGSFQAWLFRIAHNVFVNQERSNRRRQDFPDDWPSGVQSPADQAMSKENLQLLARAVGRLPADFRAPFLLRVEMDMTFEVIGDVLDITPETARWRVFKARQKLMDVLAPQLEQELP